MANIAERQVQTLPQRLGVTLRNRRFPRRDARRTVPSDTLPGESSYAESEGEHDRSQGTDH